MPFRLGGQRRGDGPRRSMRMSRDRCFGSVERDYVGHGGEKGTEGLGCYFIALDDDLALRQRRRLRVHDGYFLLETSGRDRQQGEDLAGTCTTLCGCCGR